MKLKNFIKQIDPVIDVIIWESDDEDEPSFEGALFNIPHRLINKKIGRKKDEKEEPVYISIKKNKFNVELPVIVINVLS